jgi:hypothetical protein
LVGNKDFIKIYPGRNKPTIQLKHKLSLEEYLIACGFEISKNPMPSFGLEKAEAIFSYYLHAFDREMDLDPLVFLFSKRDKKVESISEVEGLAAYLDRIGYIPLQENQLSKVETKYLTGDWFEEFFYYQLKESKNLDENAIATGCVIRKNNIPNEFDILFLENDQLKVVECKTFIWKFDKKQREKSYAKGHGIKVNINCWNKGKKGLQTAWNKGKTHLQNEDNPLWKGSSASLVAKHSWIKRRYGRPQRCEHCGTTENRMYHWANISGEYKRDINDYKRLCVPCHKKYDLSKLK